MTIAAVIAVASAIASSMIWYLIYIIRKNTRLELELKVMEHRDEVNKTAAKRKPKIKTLVAEHKSTARDRVRKRSRSGDVSKTRVHSKGHK